MMTNPAASATSETPACEKAMDRFLELDKGERIPLQVTAHLLRCRHCRTQVRLMSLAERVAARRDCARRDCARRGGQPVSQQNPVTLTGWVVGGICMIVLMLAFALVAELYARFALQTAFYLVFAGSVTAYCALFVGANMDFFVKKMHR